jgi:transcription elongation GreA/GreB family factor
MMTDKALLKTTMLNLTTERLAYSECAYADYLRRSAHDQSEAEDYGQAAKQFEDAEVAQAFECPIQTHMEAIAKLSEIDFGPKLEVVEGASVRFNGHWFVVATATKEFMCDGIPYMGISKEAPIFEAMQGKAAGDTFEFNGREIRIEAVA